VALLVESRGIKGAVQSGKIPCYLVILICMFGTFSNGIAANSDPLWKASVWISDLVTGPAKFWADPKIYRNKFSMEKRKMNVPFPIFSIY
jgi:hypothetical protein